MLSGIFQKRRKIHELRAPTLQDIKKFRDLYAKHADARHVETPSCFEKSIYKAISCQRELHTVDFRQEDITDPQLIALAEALVQMPMISSLDLRDNRITDDGAKALLEVLRLQIIAAKTPMKTDQRTRRPVFPQVPEYTRYVTSVNIKGNEISAAVMQELVQYTEILKREDKRLEIRAALNQIDRNSDGGIDDEEEFRAVLKLLTGTEPSKKEIKALMSQYATSGDNAQSAMSLENLLLAKCASSPSKKLACPPWEALVQVKHANLSVHNMPLAHAQGAHLQQLYQQKLHMYGSSSTTTPPPAPAPLQRAQTARDAPSIQVAMGAQRLPVHTFQRQTTSPAGFGSMNSIALSPTPSSSAGSERKSIADFKPPASPPPPLPLPQTASSPTSSKRGSSASIASDTSFFAKSEREPSSPRNSPDRRQSKEKEELRLPINPVPVIVLSSPSSPIFDVGPDDLLGEFTDDEGSSQSGTDQSASASTGDEGTVLSSEPRASPPQAAAVPDHRSSTSSAWNTTGNSESLSQAVAHLSDDEDSGDRSTAAATVGENAGVGAMARGDRRVTAKTNDLSSLVYHEKSNNGRTTSGDLVTGSPETPENQADNEKQQEQVDVVICEVQKDQKPRQIAKLVHSDFKRGLRLADFPLDVPFRNLLALILSDNRLEDLQLFKDLRFPVLHTLDLSKNRLSRFQDDDLEPFPRLRVLDLGHNQLKQLHGLTRVFELQALNWSHNGVKIVENIGHMTQLQVLNLSHNAIHGSPALRTLSLNKMLQHLDLDGNHVIETDERQRRKNIVSILNIVPMLVSLGTVPCITLHAKERKKQSNAASAKKQSLFEGLGLSPSSLWVAQACEWLQCFQDSTEASSFDSEMQAPSSPMPKKLSGMTREEQRQRDELRSRAVAFRSRAKAPPSPPKPKTSKYAFGPPLPPPPPKKKKKTTKAPVEPEVIQKQQRRASELSAPKHPPVNKTLLEQEQRRKSRPAFDVNMSVAERLELVQHKRSSMTLTGRAPSIKIMKKKSITKPQETQPDEPVESPARTLLATLSRSNSPAKEYQQVGFQVNTISSSPSKPSIPSPIQTPTPTPSKPAPAPVSSPAKSIKPSSCGDSFLLSLAVEDFLVHAEEELSTAVTALNVLLSMSEKTTSDPTKLQGYRSSLEALNILDESESLALYEKTKGMDDADKRKQCDQAHEKLQMAKKCLKALLEKLEGHAPGSSVIRAFGRSLRATELKDLLPAAAPEEEEEEEKAKKDAAPRQQEQEAPTESEEAEASPPSSEKTSSFHRKLFGSIASASSSSFASPIMDESTASNNNDVGTSLSPSPQKKETAVETKKDVEDDDEFAFLSDKTSMFEDDEPITTTSSVTRVWDTHEEAEDSSAFDVTHDIQLKEEETEEAQVVASSDQQEDEWLNEDTHNASEWLPVEETAVTHEYYEQEEQQTYEEQEPVYEHEEQEQEQGYEQEQAYEQEQVYEQEQEYYEDQPSFENAVTTDDGGSYADEAPAADTQEYVTAEDYEGGAAEESDAHDDEDDEEAETFGDWEKGFDPNTNHYFWFNHATGESSWTPPEGWPYEVDTPFEEDEVHADEAAEEAQPYEEEDPHLRHSVTSDFDDDVFSDHDLPM